MPDVFTSELAFESALAEDLDDVPQDASPAHVEPRLHRARLAVPPQGRAVDARANAVRIDCNGLPLSIANRLRNLAAFRNPEYSKRLRMHLSVRDTPRIVDLSRLDGGELVLPRGCVEAALSVLRDAGVCHRGTPAKG